MLITSLVSYVFMLGLLYFALRVVTHDKPMSAAMNLVGMMVLLSILYMQWQAFLPAVIQIIVYSGAIMVVFVFVIMMLNQGSEIDNTLWHRIKNHKLDVITSLFVLFVCLLAAVLGVSVHKVAAPSSIKDMMLDGPVSSGSSVWSAGSVYSLPNTFDANLHAVLSSYMVPNREMAVLLFTKYLWAFEWVGVALLLCVLGVIWLTLKYRNHKI
jgi:NADH:ubiquinone oxidoreductase subunit 6 (subunit J)